jgi:hypothetical protein
MPIAHTRFQNGLEVAQVACGAGVEALDPVGRILRDRDHSQDADDRDDDQKLDESKAFSVSELVYNFCSFRWLLWLDGIGCKKNFSVFWHLINTAPDSKAWA